MVNFLTAYYKNLNDFYRIKTENFQKFRVDDLLQLFFFKSIKYRLHTNNKLPTVAQKLSRKLNRFCKIYLFYAV